MYSSSSSSRNWVYDVFVSFKGEDVRKTFLSHFQKELDRKLIKTFIDEKIEKGQSLDPVLRQAIKTSRIAVVVFSENYASSSWCLDELVEIVKCKEEMDQVVIPIFYGVEPCHVRHQLKKFGQVFAKTCERKSENEQNIWRKSLIEVANLCGNHPQNWANEAKMVEKIVNDVLDKILKLIPRKDFGDFVGMGYHIAKMIELLDLESQEVRMVGIWGTSGIGKTSIARTLYSQLSYRFQCKIFIDKAFVSNAMKKYENANPYDPNVRLHLVGSFLSKILDKRDIKVDSFDAMRQMLKHHKVLIFIDDLDHQEVLNTLVGQTQWFGCGSRIIVITKDKQFLRAHGIDHIYEVPFPSNELALKMFCKSAFGIYFPPDGLMEFASKVASSAGNLPLGLHVLGSYVKGQKKENLNKILPSLLKGLNGNIKKTLRVSYDGLDDENHKAIFRHIACLFNGESASDVKLLLADSDIDVIIGLENLVDKSLIHIRSSGIIEMHSLLHKMGKEIVRAQSNEPGEREFIVDAKDICDLLENNSGTNKVLGIALDMEELHIHELRIHERAFVKMPKLCFLKIYTKDWYQKTWTTKWDKVKGVRWSLPEGFDYLPQKLRLLTLDKYPRRCLPSRFYPENLVKLRMRKSKLEKLWKGVQTLNGLKEMDLNKSIYLKEIPDLSKATNLETLKLSNCSSLVELPSSIKYLNKLENLWMQGCISLETLPNGINLQSLDSLNLEYCPRLNSFPDISTNISELHLSQEGTEAHLNLSIGNIGMKRITSETLWARAQPYSLRILYLFCIPSLVELPSSIKNFIQLELLDIRECINLETLPTDINFFSLQVLRFRECPQLRIFPSISTNIRELELSGTGIEEVPWWIENFTKLRTITMQSCSKLVRVSNIYNLKYLEEADFSDCGALTEASWNGSPIATDDVLRHQNLQLRFVNLDPEAILQNQSIVSNSMVLSGEEMPSYFTHQTTGYSFTNIPLRLTSFSQQLFKFKACMVVDVDSDPFINQTIIYVRCRFKDRLGNNFLWNGQAHRFDKIMSSYGSQLWVLNYLIPPDKCNAPLAQLNYDHVDMEIHKSGDTKRSRGYGDSRKWFKIKKWGIQLIDECSSALNRLSNPYKVLVSESEDRDEDSEEDSDEYSQEDTESEDSDEYSEEYSEEDTEEDSEEDSEDHEDSEYNNCHVCEDNLGSESGHSEKCVLRETGSLDFWDKDSWSQFLS